MGHCQLALPDGPSPSTREHGVCRALSSEARVGRPDSHRPRRARLTASARWCWHHLPGDGQRGPVRTRSAGPKALPHRCGVFAPWLEVVSSPS